MSAAGLSRLLRQQFSHKRETLSIPPFLKKVFGLRGSKSSNNSKAIGVNKSGFVDLEADEGLLFFDNFMPIKRARYTPSYEMFYGDKANIQADILKECIPQSLKDDPFFAIKNTIPRPKDGGAFVHFKFRADDKESVAYAINDHLKKEKPRRWFSGDRIRMFPVRGKPWFEDMNRFPSKRLRVEFFPGPEGEPRWGQLSQETLHSLFRRYGKIADIIPQPPPKDVGTEPCYLPKATIIKFRKIHCATTARNCLDGYTVPHSETVHGGKEGNLRLRIVYEKGLKLRWIGYWITDNPRVSIPLIIVLFGVVVYIVFDPLRDLFVRWKITGGPRIVRKTQEFVEEKFRNFFRGTCFACGADEHELEPPSKDTMEQLEKLKEWMHHTAVVVHGPRRGKRKLIEDHVLKDVENVLVIDCKPIAEAPGDNATVEAAAIAVGYPVLPAIISDLTLTAGLGTEATRQSFETQLDEILQVTRVALQKVALREKTGADQHLSDDVYLHERPEKRPVVVIDNFLHREKDNVVYEKLAECAAQLIEDNVANVIFLTNDSAFFKSLPDRLFRTILLHDEHTPGKANDDDAVARDILGLYVLQNRAPKKREWTPEQAWYFVKELSEKEELKYDQVLLDRLFRSSGEHAVQNLQRAEMISIVMNDKNGRPEIIKPKRPQLRDAFKRLTGDRILAAKMDLQSLQALRDIENTNICRMEDELERLSKMARLKNQPKGRAEYLLEKIESAQKRIRRYDLQIRDKKKVLKV